MLAHGWNSLDFFATTTCRAGILTHVRELDLSEGPLKGRSTDWATVTAVTYLFILTAINLNQSMKCHYGPMYLCEKAGRLKPLYMKYWSTHLWKLPIKLLTILLAFQISAVGQAVRNEVSLFYKTSVTSHKMINCNCTAKRTWHLVFYLLTLSLPIIKARC